MRKSGRTIALGAAVTALALAPIAGAKPHEPKGHGHGHGSGKAKGVSYIFKGTYVDATTVEVSKGNAHVRKAGLTGGPVQFDFSTAKVSVADTNGDGASDLADVIAGDRVVVKVKAPKGDPGEQPFTARQLVDQTNAEDSEVDDSELPEEPAAS